MDDYQEKSQHLLSENLEKDFAVLKYKYNQLKSKNMFLEQENEELSKKYEQLKFISSLESSKLKAQEDYHFYKLHSICQRYSIPLSFFIVFFFIKFSTNGFNIISNIILSIILAISAYVLNSFLSSLYPSIVRESEIVNQTANDKMLLATLVLGAIATILIILSPNVLD